MFNENSGLVLVWVNEIKLGNKELNDVPEISNLKEIVSELVK